MKYTGPQSTGSGGGGLPGVTVPLVTFTVGSGDPDVPNNGDTSWHVGTFQGQSLANKQLQPVREGIDVLYNTAATTGDLDRFNDGAAGGFDFTVASGLTFQLGERWQIFIMGVNNTIE